MPDSERDLDFLGLRRSEAERLAKERGVRHLRVLSQGQPYRTDLMPERLNLVLDEREAVQRTWRG